MLNENELINFYQSNKTKKEIAKILNVSVPTVERNIRCLQINHKPAGGQRKYKLNENYFDEIDTEEKAYWLGFILADGCVKNNSNYLTINLSSIDEMHLCKFISSLNSNYKINRQLNQGTCGMSSVTMTSKILTDSLRTKGIVANSKKVFDIDETLEKHYWRGVIDGDGCIHLGYNNKCPQVTISIIGTPDTVAKFRSFCIRNVETHAKIEKDFRKNTDYFRVHGSKALVICEILYQDAQVFLDRKLNKYKICVNTIKNYRELKCSIS